MKIIPSWDLPGSQMTITLKAPPLLFLSLSLLFYSSGKKWERGESIQHLLKKKQIGLCSWYMSHKGESNVLSAIAKEVPVSKYPASGT